MSGSLRKSVGKKDAKAVRNEGRVPAVIYGTGEQTHFSLKHTDIEKLVYTAKVHLINLDIDGTKKKAFIQEVQHHPLTDRIQHADFIEVLDDRKVKVDVPVNLIGRPIGVLNGGVLSRIFRKLTVYALPDNLPDEIEVDISELRIGDSIKVGDLNFPSLNILQEDMRVICSVKMSRAAIEEEEEEEEEEVDLEAMTDEEREEYLKKKAEEEEEKEGEDGEKKEGHDRGKKEGGDRGGDGGGEKKDGGGSEGGGDRNQGGGDGNQGGGK